MFGHCHGKGERARVSRHPLSDLVEDEAEHRSVECVEYETGRTGEPAASDQTPQQLDVRVVTAEEAPVDRLEQAPCRRGDGAGESGVDASGRQGDSMPEVLCGVGWSALPGTCRLGAQGVEMTLNPLRIGPKEVIGCTQSLLAARFMILRRQGAF